MNKKLAELSEEELADVIGGTQTEFNIDDQSNEKEFHIYEENVKKEFKPGF